MIVQHKIDNLNNYQINDKSIDWLALEWYETKKRIQTKKTNSGKELSLKFLSGNPHLTQGDILFEDENSIIAIDILVCDCIIITPKNKFETASVCYEIGNKHLPLFFEEDELLVPMDIPLFNLLAKQGYTIIEEKRKLLNALRTSVAPHLINETTVIVSKTIIN